MSPPGSPPASGHPDRSGRRRTVHLAWPTDALKLNDPTYSSRWVNQRLLPAGHNIRLGDRRDPRNEAHIDLKQAVSIRIRDRDRVGRAGNNRDRAAPRHTTTGDHVDDRR